MRITYDPEVDALYILFRQGLAADSRDVVEGVTVDLDAEGRIIGLEVLDASDRLGEEALGGVDFERLRRAG